MLDELRSAIDELLAMLEDVLADLFGTETDDVETYRPDSNAGLQNVSIDGTDDSIVALDGRNR